MGADCASDVDRRSSLIVLTDEGEQAFRAAGRVHFRGINEIVGSRLTPDEMIELRALLAKLTDDGGS